MRFGEALGPVAGLVSLAGFVPYVRDVVARRTVPSRSTWAIWTLVGALLCASNWTTGATSTLGISASYVAGPLVVFALSLRFGKGGLDRFERRCLAVSVASVILWSITREARVALWLNVAVDAMGALPTIRKAYREPESESRVAWACFLVGATLNLGALPSAAPTVLAYPLYLFAVAATMTFLIASPKRRARAAAAERRGSDEGVPPR